MARTGKVTTPFPYAVDGVTIETLAVGRVLSFPDLIFPGLKDGGFIERSTETPENSVAEAISRDLATSELRERLGHATDQELKDIIARSGIPVSGNLVHAELVSAAAAQMRREAEGQAVRAREIPEAATMGGEEGQGEKPATSAGKNRRP